MKHDKEFSWPEKLLWEETIITSPNSIDLAKTARSDYLHRLSAYPPHVAELFQENSKLTRCSTLEVPLDYQKLEEMRKWYFNTAYATREEDFNSTEAYRVRMPMEALPEKLASLLRMFSQPGSITNLLYALDLFLLYKGRLFKVVPQSKYLWIEKDYQADEVQRLKQEIIDLPQNLLDHAWAFLFMVGVAWRYMMLYGPRGYRHTLIDTGRLLAQLEAKASQIGIQVKIAQNFYDNPIDNLLSIDGVERSTLTILALEEG